MSQLLLDQLLTLSRIVYPDIMHEILKMVYRDVYNASHVGYYPALQNIDYYKVKEPFVVWSWASFNQNQYILSLLERGNFPIERYKKFQGGMRKLHIIEAKERLTKKKIDDMDADTG